jgi:hypothetical protein
MKIFSKKVLLTIAILFIAFYVTLVFINSRPQPEANEALTIGVLSNDQLVNLLIRVGFIPRSAKNALDNPGEEVDIPDYYKEREIKKGELQRILQRYGIRFD